MGQKIGVLGKEGASGGWSHLHFDITCRQPSGQWGIQNAYAFAWEAYQRQYRPEIIAVARPHCVGWAGESVELDAGRSWSRCGTIEKFEWTFCDGGSALGDKVRRTYDEPGEYNEILKITDARGNVDYDFAVVQVFDKAHPNLLPPPIHAAYYPTSAIKAGDELTFKVAHFAPRMATRCGISETAVRSDRAVRRQCDAHNPEGYAVTKHAYRKPGCYIATVRRSDERGWQAITHLFIRVGDGA
jgi:hypothetical protein